MEKRRLVDIEFQAIFEYERMQHWTGDIEDQEELKKKPTQIIIQIESL